MMRFWLIFILSIFALPFEPLSFGTAHYVSSASANSDDYYHGLKRQKHLQYLQRQQQRMQRSNRYIMQNSQRHLKRQLTQQRRTQQEAQRAARYRKFRADMAQQANLRARMNSSYGRTVKVALRAKTNSQYLRKFTARDKLRSMRIGKSQVVGASAPGLRLSYNKSTKSWTTPAGLIYGQGSAHGNRVKHVLAHTKPHPNPKRAQKHSIFSTSPKDTLALVDRAWRARGTPQKNDPGVYVVNLNKKIGTRGETRIKIVTKPGTSEIITAYPVN